MALGGTAWRNETRAWRRAMLKTPRPNTDYCLNVNSNIPPQYIPTTFLAL